LTLAQDRDDPALGADPLRNNDFTYAADPEGRQVPLGSHMRRMNPRDTKMALLVEVNIHRMIRRSTTFGAPYDPNVLSEQDDETPRGLYFIFLSAKAMATMEFLQQEWINNGNFMSLGDERDPNVGLQEDARPSRSPECRSAAGFTASKPSTCCGAANTSSCPPLRRCSGSERSADR
jgi:deferrochelatase/peroxidase EfeB